jgi:hypothetical protein
MNLFFIFVRREARCLASLPDETLSFLDYYNKVLCMDVPSYCYRLCIVKTDKIYIIFKITERIINKYKFNLFLTKHKLTFYNHIITVTSSGFCL